MKNKILDALYQQKASARKAFAVLIDPDKLNDQALLDTIQLALSSKVDYFFVGGSLVVTDTLENLNMIEDLIKAKHH